MSSPTPQPDPYAAMRAALERDAASLREPPFDATLHRAAMRRIRGLGKPARARWGGWKWSVPLSLATALGILVLFIIPAISPSNRQIPAEVPLPAARATAWAYQRAANGRGDAFIEMLDHDARTLLPPSSPTFLNNLD